MAGKKITIESLAKMIKSGFDKTSTKEQFEYLDKRLVNVEKDIVIIKKDVKDIKYKLVETTSRTDKLETRVDYVENMLVLPKKG